MTTKLILIIAVCVSFGAGLLIGMETRNESVVASNDPKPTTTPSTRNVTTTREGRMQGFLSAQLKLSPDQQKQMQEIWESSMRDNMRQHDEKRRTLRTQRDESIAALIGEDRKSEYDAVLKRYSDGQDAIEKEMRANFDRAVEATKQILTPDQRVEYERILKDRQGGPWDRDRGPGPRRDRDGTTTNITTKPS